MTIGFFFVLFLTVILLLMAVAGDRSLFILLIFLLCSQLFSLLDIMDFTVKGIFDLHAILIILFSLIILVSFGRVKTLFKARNFVFFAVFLLFAVFGVIYPYVKEYSSIFYSLKASKEFLMILAYPAVFLFIRNRNQVDRSWGILVFFGVFYSILEIVAQIFGATLLSKLNYAYQAEGPLWKVYPPFWIVILIALFVTLYKSVMRLKFSSIILGVVFIGLLLTFFRSYLLASFTVIPLVLLMSKLEVFKLLGRGLLMGVFMILVVVVFSLSLGGVGAIEKVADDFLFSAISELRENKGGALQGREKFAEKRRKILNQSKYVGFGFIDKDSSFGKKVAGRIKGHTLGFLDKGDVDVALKFGIVGRFILYLTVIMIGLRAIFDMRKIGSSEYSARLLTVATMCFIFILVQPVHAPITYSFGLLPLFICLALLDKERLLLIAQHRVKARKHA